MTINKLAIIGGSGLYDVEEFKNRELLDLNTPWGRPSDQILKTNFNNRRVLTTARGYVSAMRSGPQWQAYVDMQ